MQVFKQKIYMRLYGAVSNKPTTLWSNTAAVAELDLGPIPKKPLPHIYVWVVNMSCKPKLISYTCCSQGTSPDFQASCQGVQGCAWENKMYRGEVTASREPETCLCYLHEQARLTEIKLATTEAVSYGIGAPHSQLAA